ncbi:MAG: FG-GAP-like repeat-containing protein [Myxococcota bacterium]|jgi:hypothetical protein|nr:FG-GAP-like repeat-containing protein [Myxococcota bacterium]
MPKAQRRPLPLLFAVLLCACDPALHPDQGASAPQRFELLTQAPYPGAQLLFEGDFLSIDHLACSRNSMLSRLDEIQLSLGERPIPIRAIEPSRLIAELPLDATSNVLHVQRSGRSALQLDLQLGQKLPAHCSTEHEPNQSFELAQEIDLRKQHRRTIFGATQEPQDLDGFRLLLPPRKEDAKYLTVRLEQASHHPQHAGVLSIRSPGGMNPQSIAFDGLEDPSLLFELASSTQTQFVEIQWENSITEGRYEVELSIPSALPTTPILAAPASALQGLPLSQDGSATLHCSVPAVLDVNGDGQLDWLCGELYLGGGQGSFAPEAEPAPMCGSWTRWAAFGPSMPQFFVVGPEPRTHRLLAFEEGRWQDRTVRAGLAAVTGMELLDAHLLDLDDDGVIDLLAVPKQGAVRVFHGMDTGFQESMPWDHNPFPSGWSSTYSLVFDADNDGDVDLLLFGYSENSATLQALRIINQAGRLHALDERRLDPGMNCPQLEAARPFFANDDDALDLLLVCDGNLGLHLSNGGMGSASYLERIDLGHVDTLLALSVFDFNTDGSLDVFAASASESKLWLLEGERVVEYRREAQLPRLPLGALSPIYAFDGASVWLHTPSAPLRLFTRPHRYLLLRAEDGSSLPNGTRITVRSQGLTQRRVLGANQHAWVLGTEESLFFFPEYCSTADVELRFPSGLKLVRSGEALDRVLHIAGATP